MAKQLLVMSVFGLLGACQYESRALVDIPIEASGASEREWTLDGGGLLAIDEASVTFSDLRLEEPPAADLASLLRSAPLGLWGAAPAYAHPGHDYPGDVAGELLGTFTVDLLAPAQALGAAPCYEGAYSTGRVTLSGTALHIAGSYTSPEGETVPLLLDVDVDQDIIGIPFDAEIAAESPPGAIVVRFDLRRALQFTDWSLPESDGDGEITMADSPYGNTVLFGAVSTPTWSLSTAL